jgi:prepilin signal peptidase PulO-like enzyme (type II secretory pathway)
MISKITVLYGLIGIILGYTIPYLSFRIMEYKKGKGNVNSSKIALYSKIFKVFLSLSSCGVWMFIALNVNDLFVGLLIGILIILGLIIIFIDIQIRIIPNELVIALAVVGIIFQLYSYGLLSMMIAIVCMVVMMGVFTSAASFVGFGKVGAGDVKLSGAMGLALGYPLVITAVEIMAIVLLVYITIGFVIKKIFLSTMLPLAPFMISGFIFALITLLF